MDKAMAKQIMHSKNHVPDILDWVTKGVETEEGWMARVDRLENRHA
jgi:hypothetical protein